MESGDILVLGVVHIFVSFSYSQRIPSKVSVIIYTIFVSYLQQDPDAFQDKMVTVEKELSTLHGEVVNLPAGSLGWRAREPSGSSSRGSPVSVITSPPPIIPPVIKSEPLSSE
jgi:hypothetical protein